MIREDLIAERIVIEVYQEMVRYFGNNDPTTRHLMEEILADEEEHASDLADLLYIVNPETGQTEGQDPGTQPLGPEPAQERKPMGTQREQKSTRETSALASAEPVRTPGASGRPMNRRGRQPDEEVDIETAEFAEGAHSGGTRGVNVTNKNRKNKSRRAA